MPDESNDAEVTGSNERYPDATIAGARIAIDARYLRRPGMGIHTYLSAGIQLLLDEGAEVSLLANFPEDEAATSYSGTRWEGFGSKRNIVWEQINLPRHIRKQTFDFYWAPGNSGIPFLSLGRTHSVSSTHDIIPLRLPRIYLYQRPGFALPYFVWTFAAILRSDILITGSQASADDINRTFHRRPVVIPSNLQIVQETDVKVKVPANLQDTSYLVFNGGMDPRKNVKNLLEGFAIVIQQYPDLHLAIMGNRSEMLLPLISKLGIRENVILTGFVDESEKSAILSGAKAMVYPSLYEGFGLPLLEAFAADLPLVTSRNSALSEIAGDAAIYINPLEPFSIAEGILTILQDEIANEHRERGRQRLKEFNVFESRRKFVEVFSSSFKG